MPINLTTPVSTGNGTRLSLSLTPGEAQEVAFITAELRTSVANGDLIIASRTFAVRNGLCDVVRKRASIAPGSFVGELLEVVTNGINLAAGYDNAVAAYYGAAKPARKAALEAHGLVAGWIDSTLGGT